MRDRRADLPRRAWLAGIATGMAGTAGCVGRFQRAAERDELEQVSIEVLTVPEDADPHALRIANHLAGNMEDAGMAVHVQPTRMQTLLRDVLINRDFDMYVWRHPGQFDPDTLRPLLHSRFSEEPGWQNPFGYSSVTVDELVDEQRRAPNGRKAVIEEFHEAFFEEYPFIPIAFEAENRLLRRDRIETNEDIAITNPLWPASLRPLELPEEEGEELEVRLGMIDLRATRNLNPISVDYRGPDHLTELIYDPLFQRVGSEFHPWLAVKSEWVSREDAQAPSIEVTLREGAQWHDGEPITAADVTFTMALYADTTVTDDDPTLPAPRFRGRSSLVESTEAVNDRKVRMQFIETSRQVAQRALTVPILPRHVWKEYTDLAEIAGIEIAGQTTDAMIIDNTDPVGSGLYEVEEVTEDVRIRLVRNNDHFVGEPADNDTFGRDLYLGEFDVIEIELRPSVRNVAESIREGELDGCMTNLGADLVNEMTTNAAPLSQYRTQTTRLFHVGFNLRTSPFTSHRFRRGIGGMLDREYLQKEVFEGSAMLTASPLVNTDYVSEEYRWPTDRDVGFVGEAGEGEIDAEAARELFREAGFSYSEGGELLAQR